MTGKPTQRRRQWRFYETATGNKPVKRFLDGLPAAEAVEVLAEMRDVARQGLIAARHLRGDIWEVRVDAETQAFRVLFAAEGRYKQILLALEGFSKKTQKTPPQTINLADRRLADWRLRGETARKQMGKSPEKKA